MTIGFDISDFQAAVEKHWRYHNKCQNLSWAHFKREDGIFEIEAAPVYQSVFGGKDDGKKVWVGFEVCLTDLFTEPGMQIEAFGCVSYCPDYSPTPSIPIRGTFREHPFVFRLMLEPVPGSEPIEIVDTLKAEIRTIRETHHE